MGAPVTRLAIAPADGVGRRDPLINALFEKLPAPGQAFSAAQRKAWLDMMEKTLTVVYDAAAAEAPVAPRRTIVPKAAAAPRAKKPKAAGKAQGRPAPQFTIDLQGFARNAAGERVLPDDVNDVIVDLRGETGDLGAIVWADDTRGVSKAVTGGRQLEITTSQV